VTIWLDVEDIFVHAQGGRRRISGIQRFVLEVCRAIQEDPALLPAPHHALRYLRHARVTGDYTEIGWAALQTLFEDADGTAAPSSTAALVLASLPNAALKQNPRAPGTARRLLRRLPADALPHLARAAAAQRLALRESAAATRQLSKALRSRRGSFGPRRVPPDQARCSTLAEPGDVLLFLGAGWILSDHAERIRKFRQRGARYVMLLHDLIPALRPEFAGRAACAAFDTWLSGVLPQASTLLTISQASARDLAIWTQRHDLPAASPVVVPMGTSADALARLPPRPIAGLPANSFALCVATIEPRKNQHMLVRVWRQLIEQLGPAKVPPLVLAGHVGQHVKDMMAELEATDFLDGMIRVVPDPSDEILAALYRECRFTVFASLYEGWGLPVTESLLFGKPCFASSRTAIPEAGGALVRYFDPECVPDAVRLIRASLEDPGDLARWAGDIARLYRPTPWQDTARAILQAADQGAAVEALSPA
jgi:glycosyltransferase involved in cell wall biosynthesis